MNDFLQTSMPQPKHQNVNFYRSENPKSHSHVSSINTLSSLYLSV